MMTTGAVLEWKSWFRQSTFQRYDGKPWWRTLNVDNIMENKVLINVELRRLESGVRLWSDEFLGTVYKM